MSLPKTMSYLEHGRIEVEDETSKTPLWVIPKDLCTRCGACDVICPVNGIDFDDHEFPYIKVDKCIDCGLCLEVCPGIAYDMPGIHQEIFGVDYVPDRMSGHFHKAYVGYAKSQQVRENGSAGGVVTQILLSLLKAGHIDGAVVVTNNPDDPALPKPIIARTEQEIMDAAQSKYTTVANTKVLREMRGSNDKLAFVGVACQIHGLRKLEKLNPRIARRVSLVIGLACRGTLERDAMDDLLRVQGVNPAELSKVLHRDGPFPGKFRAHYKDDRIQNLHHFEYKDGAYNMMVRMYLPDRCHLCTDYSSEYADVTCSDMWVRNERGGYQFAHGSTLVICRTERGEQAIEALLAAGDIILEPVESDAVEASYHHLRRERKVMPFLRMREREAAGKFSPQYGLDVDERLSHISRSDLWYDRLYLLTFIFNKHPRARLWMMRLIFSPVGTVLVYLKIKLKQFRAMLRARKQKRSRQALL